MNGTAWLRALDCPLLQLSADDADPLSLRLVQRLLELGLAQQGCDDLARTFLEEAGGALRADQAALLEARPAWEVRWQYLRRGARPLGEALPRTLLGEVLDRQAGAAQPPAGGSPAFLAACLSYTERPNRVLLVVRPREPFHEGELQYAVAVGHYLGVGLERGQAWDERTDTVQRLEALLAIGRQLVEQRETVPLLEHIAEQATRLLRCERASIFLWDQNRHQLVGRPALGIDGGELRIPDDAGVVGKVVQTGEVLQVDDVQAEPGWNPQIDAASGFQTRNLLCVPLVDAAGQRLGALEVLNKTKGRFDARDADTLQALAAQTVVALQNVREREALLRSNAQLEGQARQGSRIVGDSTAIQALRGTIDRVARTDLPVLITGESGTGKEVVAQAMHYSSPRGQEPFVAVNCAAIAETLLESELFGHEKGAFTDAHTTRQGKFELASGGTLFLDEIGDLSAGGQAKLLRVLEEKVVYRVGGSQAIAVDTRIVAATNRNLGEAVRAGKFREDLFYRLTVVTLELPPLRERREDITMLAEYFLQKFSRDAGRRTLKLSAEARRRLDQHNWPGNVRELRNLLERIAFLCPNDRVEADDLTFILRPAAEDTDRFAELTLADATDTFQREHITRAIERARQNMTDAAKLLGLHRSNLYRKMKMLGMEIP
ncbi:MAG TPA: sigma 54-interacting transcriptional regulator [Gemmataceae bacterium]|nr:sigma 54-interacting transcriptional regulator [Gemmataceae bacterium]